MSERYPDQLTQPIKIRAGADDRRRLRSYPQSEAAYLLAMHDRLARFLARRAARAGYAVRGSTLRAAATTRTLGWDPGDPLGLWADPTVIPGEAILDVWTGPDGAPLPDIARDRITIIPEDRP